MLGQLDMTTKYYITHMHAADIAVSLRLIAVSLLHGRCMQNVVHNLALLQPPVDQILSVAATDQSAHLAGRSSPLALLRSWNRMCLHPAVHPASPGERLASPLSVKPGLHHNTRRDDRSGDLPKLPNMLHFLHIPATTP
jgi:hypothetical protein